MRKKKFSRGLNIWVTEQMYQDLEHIAKVRGESLAQATRDCVAAVIRKAKEKGAWTVMGPVEDEENRK